MLGWHGMLAHLCVTRFVSKVYQVWQGIYVSHSFYYVSIIDVLSMPYQKQGKVCKYVRLKIYLLYLPYGHVSNLAIPLAYKSVLLLR